MLDLIILDESRRFAARIDQSPCNGCDECGARCTAGVPMLEAEYQAIAAFVTGPEGEDARRVERLDKQVPYPGAEEFHYTACRFRDVEQARCSIYPVRPLVCRLFGHVEWLPCPIGKVEAVPGGVSAMQRYGEAAQKTYEEWGACGP
ncbi:MAG: YkgJ family cysteine cluster protein [Actinomycetota bacterium]